MGLLDWLGDVFGPGGGMGGGGTMPVPDAMGNATGMTAPNPIPAPAPTQPMPPVQMTGEDRSPPLLPPDGGDLPGPSSRMAPLNPPDGGDLPSSRFAPVPLPQPRPAAADAIPANAAPTGGTLPPTGPASLAPSVPGPEAPPPTPGGSFAMPAMNASGGLLGALGLSPETAKRARGNLGAGLKAVGENWNKPGLAAFAGTAGAGIEGGTKAESEDYNQRIKYLSAAITAQSAGDKAEYNRNYAAYLAGKLKQDAEKATPQGKSAWNKPDSQKFIDAQHVINANPEIKAAAKGLENAQKLGTPDEIAKAEAKLKDVTDRVSGQVMTGVGLDAKKMAAMAANPPGSPQNPHQVMSKQDFDTYVKPGQAYINPKDGKVYIRKGGDVGSGAPAAAPSPVEPPGPRPGAARTPAPADEED